VHNLHLAAELSRRVEEVRAQAAELAASRDRVVAGQDAERRRIQRILHDGVQQEIVALSARAGLVRQQLLRGDPAAAEGLADAAHAIRSGYPRTGVVVLSQYADESYAFELFRDGTDGLAYLLKDRIGEVGRLLEALREVSAGGSLIDPQVVEALVRRRARVHASALKDLTPRELDVLQAMAQGRGNAGIAAHLHLSESSVEKHVNAIFTKLGLTTEDLSHRRVTAVLTFLRDAGLRG
jgi:DNA-binding NarL/FixJ family response regulator